MPTRFPTEAANADFIGEDPDQSRGREPQSMPPPSAAQDDMQNAADAALGQPQRPGRGTARQRRTPRADATPGKELNGDPKEG